MKNEPELTVTGEEDYFEVDEPFSLVTVKPPPMSGLLCVVPSPKGDELVDPSWCDEPTRIMSREEIRCLLRQAGPHTHETLRSMVAVTPPSSRREPEEMVTVVGAEPAARGQDG